MPNVDIAPASSAHWVSRRAESSAAGLDAERPTLGERAGHIVGRLASPLFAAVSAMRGARAFHPDGMTCAGYVEALESRDFRGLGARLSGHVIVRFSGALLRRGMEAPDALGIAVRFRRRPAIEVEADDDDQDILFATLRSIFTAPLATLATNQHDFLANTYFAAAPFEVAGMGRLLLRLTPMAAPRTRRGSREEKLFIAVESGRVRLRLEARRPFTATYVPVAILHIDAVAPLDQEALAFSPFRAGRGIHPRGFVHAMRRAVYPASVAARRRP
jgi:hypothetical protein